MSEIPRMPLKEEILARATQLFMEEKARLGLPPITPEEDELKEGSYWNRARNELMSGVRTQLEGYLAYLEGEASKIREELGIEEVIPEEKITELENKLSTISERYKVTKERLEESRREVERLKPPPVPLAPPKGLSTEQKHKLEDAFKRVFEEAGIARVPLATFRDEMVALTEDLKETERTRAFDIAYKRIVDLARSILPPRPVMPPAPVPTPPLERPEVVVPLVELLGPRRRQIETVQCWIEACPELAVVDRDLMRRVTLVPVSKAWSPRGTRFEPLLAFPPTFFYSCETHRYEKFGYRSIYDALAYLLFESRSSTKRLTITKGSLREAGLDEEDILAIQAAEAKWIAPS